MPVGDNRFSLLRKDGKTAGRWPTTKVWHSAKDWFKARSKVDIAKEAATQVGTTGLAIGSAVGGALVIAGTGTAVVSEVAVGVAGATAAVTAAGVLCAPVLAFAACFIGLGFLAKSMYSDREKNHDELKKYVYSLIDDDEPEKNVYRDEKALETAAKAAVYLLKEGDSQIATMGTKLADVEKKYRAFIVEYYQLVSALRPPNWAATQKFMKDYAAKAPGRRTPEDLEEVMAFHAVINDGKLRAGELWTEAIEDNGRVAEFLRRLIHCGNYLQAPAILYASMINAIGHAVVDPGDPYKGWAKGLALRKTLKEFSEEMDEVDENYGTWEKFAKAQGIAK